MFLFALFALVLMVLDIRSASFHAFRNKLSVVVYPLQEVVSAPIKFVHTATTSWFSQKEILRDNAELRAHAILLQSQLQKLLVVEHENKQLRQLLSSTRQISGKVRIAELLAIDLNPALQQVILNQGRHAGVYGGQPVIDAYGVMGQVVEVGYMTSKLLLLTDTHSAIPVKDSRNGVRGIAIGLGTLGQLSVINVADTSDVHQGDVFVTSGLGLHYPIGYPVGSVTHVSHHTGNEFVAITLSPAAHLDQTQHVLLVWPSQSVYQNEVKRLLAKGLSS